jgi:hypothetical protein
MRHLPTAANRRRNSGGGRGDLQRAFIALYF